jgi:asparagine synthase (glutamine-hydrolysing)
MCGICGVVNLDGRPVSADVLHVMLAEIAHRGPDGKGTYLDAGGASPGDPAVGLGQVRLAIVDLSENGSQPMTNEDGTLWVILNGEIYNFPALRARLAARGHPFRSSSDTEVLLHLYEERGDDCIDELEGMFAFALWDSTRRRLLLARDRLGKKPLYVYRDGRIVAFASEIKALLRHPAVARELDPAAIAPYFLHGYVPGPATFYRGISAVLPGHRLVVSADGSVATHQYWQLSFPPAGSAARIGEDDAIARVRELVTAAVAKRLIADVPLGAFLSGGIDSSIVVALMSRLLPEPVRTFSIGFAGDAAFDETRYARLVAERYRTRHTEFVVEPSAVELVETLVHHHDGPVGDSSSVPTHVLSRLTREHVTVALGGDGGDELFAGYLRFRAALLSAYLPAPVAKAGAWMAARLPDHPRHHSKVRLAQRFLRSQGSPHERLAAWQGLFHDDLESLLRPETLPHGGVDRMAHFRPHLDRVAGWSSLSQMLYLNAVSYLPDDLLTKADRCSMASSLEVRSPFLDHVLVEYVAGLPDRLKLRRGITKYVLRRAFADLLPPEVTARPKRGFGVPLATWFRGELREYVRDHLGPGARSADWLDGRYVARLLDEHRRGHRDHGGRLWAILTFEVWLRALARPVGLT